MKKQIAIFFVNPEQLTKLGPSKSLLPTSNKYCILTKNKGYLLQEVNTRLATSQVESIRASDKICLIFDDSIAIPDSRNEICKDILNMLGEDYNSELYVIDHIGAKYNIDKIHRKPILNIFKEYLIGYIAQSENKESVYAKFLVPFLNLGILDPLFAELIKQFPNQELEAKLKLLHECLYLANVKTIQLNEVLEIYSDQFEEFLRDLTPENHFIKLQRFRDILLPE